MIITNRTIPRRTVLRGLGAAVALPLIDSMVPASANAKNPVSAPVNRLGVVYVPNGMAMRNWTPPTDGAGFEMSRILRPLMTHRDRMVVLTNLNGVRSSAGVHASASTRFLTGVTPSRTESNLRAEVSVDQLVARELGKHTQLSSLELSLDASDAFGDLIFAASE